MLVAIVALVLIFGIPLSAILGNVWLRAKRLELEGGGGSNAGQRLARLEAENADLRKRVEVLETIVTSDAPATASRVRIAQAHDEELAQAVRAPASERQRQTR